MKLALSWSWLQIYIGFSKDKILEGLKRWQLLYTITQKKAKYTEVLSQYSFIQIRNELDNVM